MCREKTDAGRAQERAIVTGRSSSSTGALAQEIDTFKDAIVAGRAVTRRSFA